MPYRMGNCHGRSSQGLDFSILCLPGAQSSVVQVDPPVILLAGFGVIVKNNSPNLLSANCWPSVGRQLADRRPTVCVMFEAKVLADCRPAVGRQSVTWWQPVSNVSVTCRRGKPK